MERKFLFVLLVGIVALTAALVTQGLISGLELKGKGTAAAPGAADPLDTTYPLLNEVLQTTGERFYQPDKIEPSSELVQTLIRAFLASLDDPYSRFNTAEEYSSFRDDLNGDYEGIGAYIETRGDHVIANPIKGSPAEEAGVLSGDIILSIDGESAEGFSVTDASSRLRGPKGTQVVVEVMHPNGSTQTITITRDQIHVGSVEYTLIEPDIAKISISRFGFDTADDVKAALRDLEKPSSAPLAGLIIDLRANGGGYLQIAEEIASLFVDKGEFNLIERDRSGEKSHWSFGNNRKNLPIAVLIDEGTASASEILSGAIRDNDMGILIGRNSFGKGVIQSTFNLSDGSALILTTAEYFTPDKHPVQGVGLAPAPGYYVDSWRDPLTEISDELSKFNEFLVTFDLAQASQSDQSEPQKTASRLAIEKIGERLADLARLARDDQYDEARSVLQAIRDQLSADPAQMLRATGVAADESEGVLFERLLAGFAHHIQEPLLKLEERLTNNYISAALRWLRSPGIAGALCPCSGPVEIISGEAGSNSK